MNKRLGFYKGFFEKLIIVCVVCYARSYFPNSNKNIDLIMAVISIIIYIILSKLEDRSKFI